MQALGHLLLWLGFLAAAFCSVLRLEQSTDKWSTIPWFAYVLSMAVGVVGIALLRAAKRADHTDEEKTEAEYSIVRSSLETVVTIVERMRLGNHQSLGDVVRCIDDECVLPLANFAESRQALVKRFGMSTYAEVMTEFASAERYINRSWSAAADGYVDEVKKSLDRASAHLRKATELLHHAESTTPVI